MIHPDPDPPIPPLSAASAYDPYYNPNPLHFHDTHSSSSSFKRDNPLYIDSDLPSELPSTTEPSERAPSSYIPDDTSIESIPDEPPTGSRSSRTANHLPISAGNVTSVDVIVEPIPRGYVNDDVSYHGNRAPVSGTLEPTVDEQDHVVSVRL